jgi:predicted DNA-binding protein with PD1-like motif
MRTSRRGRTGTKGYARACRTSARASPATTLDEQVELLSLIGDVALKDGKPIVHAQAVIGRKDGTAHGDHLREAHIRPIREVVLAGSPIHIQKKWIRNLVWR